MSFEQPLVWIDLEMTGLDPDTERIVEIAVVVSDGLLERVEEGPDLVIHVPDAVLDRMDEVVVAMHADSGLTEAVRSSEVSVEDAESMVLDFVKRFVPDPRTAPLAGNSVHADRAFLRRYMPALEAYLHYRNVDVSTVKELVRRWYPRLFDAAPTKVGRHRALGDIRESIDELRWYRAQVFRPAN